jgi:hypothetical protein
MKIFIYHFRAKFFHPMLDNLALISFSFGCLETDNDKEIFKMAVDKAHEEIKEIAGNNSDEWTLSKLTFKSIEPGEG